ncbi:type IV pilus assembly protein PilM [Desulforhabdus amnigena]|uniref:Pilus assembly protein PilM n=1 Tax=Desulforhabdus amnigena TaxID=40218 RepID=A0A9W6D2V8_9BACT|nr:type IV pilus assembly protein PilM [Desulforhabdus amnigena]NLJ26426.1 type IV pilus assembly protein PilM [Deltaproteobacteria bacterium]GLI33190.1 pilus assembly protein PilM [Desulforhabdus amnigena]
MFGKKENIIGLDIGSHAIKIIQLEERDSNLKLLNLGVIPIPKEAFGEGRMTRPELVGQCIQRLASNLKIKDKIVSCAVSGYEVMIKKLELPMMTEDELGSRMQTELRQYIPYNIEEVDVDYQILGLAKERLNYMDVLLVAAKKESIREYVGLLESAGFQTAVLDVDFFALCNVFEATYGFGEESIVLLDIGANKALMNIINRGIPVFTRGLSIGGNQITERIRQTFRNSYNEAERIKLGELTEDVSKKELEEIFTSIVRNWVAECKRAIDFYYSNYPENKIEKVFLSGGSCTIPGLERVFQENTGVAVEVFNPLTKVSSDPKTFDPEYLDQIGPQMAISLGLALRKTKEK